MKPKLATRPASASDKLANDDNGNSLRHQFLITATEKDRARFWSKVDKRGPHQCWEWTRGKTDGYGAFSIKDCPVFAHRASYFFHHGSIDAPLLVCHSCDNRACCNPSHLWQGTDQDNREDCVGKKRAGGQSKTHCLRGHEYTPENTIYWKGRRACRECKRMHDRARWKVKPRRHKSGLNLEASK